MSECLGAGGGAGQGMEVVESARGACQGARLLEESEQRSLTITCKSEIVQRTQEQEELFIVGGKEPKGIRNLSLPHSGLASWRRQQGPRSGAGGARVFF